MSSSSRKIGEGTWGDRRAALAGQWSLQRSNCRPQRCVRDVSEAAVTDTVSAAARGGHYGGVRGQLSPPWRDATSHETVDES